MPIIADYSPPSGPPPLFLGYKILFLLISATITILSPCVCLKASLRGYYRCIKWCCCLSLSIATIKTNNISPHRVSLCPEGLKTGGNLWQHERGKIVLSSNKCHNQNYICVCTTCCVLFLKTQSTCYIYVSYWYIMSLIVKHISYTFS